MFHCKFVCPHLNCGFKFMTNAGLRVHMGRCPWKDEFEVDRIMAHRGAVVRRAWGASEQKGPPITGDPSEREASPEVFWPTMLLPDGHIHIQAPIPP